ncbi:MAG: tRNA preQ1(34) S-adenosylmethionine ribosyltransferase-isomerase QueA [Ktedonobacterales bacterium]
MNISDFDYFLPQERIAQTPLEPRDSSRLLVLHRHTGQLEDRVFRDIGEYLRAGDLLVANQSRVLPARLHGFKIGSGGQVELLLLGIRGDHGPDCWEALVRPGRRVHDGLQISIGDGKLLVEILSRTPSGERIVRLAAPDGNVAAALQQLGSMPLPPYIHEPLADSERYQTVYARRPGSAAAPTAGLHFTAELLAQLEQRGIDTAFVTLHIGLDTFRPVGADRLEDHVMHSEEIEIDAPTAARINATHAAGGRILAVGTTAVRTLESVAERVAERRDRGQLLPASRIDDSLDEGDIVVPFRGRTSLFLRPGSTFRATDMMLTNFHLPRSTLLVLVSAFAGRELILHAYQEAIERGYRFYSFGDAMLIL